LSESKRLSDVADAFADLEDPHMPALMIDESLSRRQAIKLYQK